jgi:membrane-bound serine protease (ClpP class)
MAPETTIGAASPVGAGGVDLDETSQRKAKEEVRALARGLTERRGTKATQLAEAMIEEARAVSASEALAAGLVDFVAPNLTDLLRQLDGFTVEVAGRPVRLTIATASVRSIEMSLIEQILTRIADPNVLALLLFVGMQAILIELSSPGGWVAGFIGVVFLALAIYGLGVLPVDWFGLVLIVVAFVLFVLDVKAPTHGALTIVGGLTLIAGLLVLFSKPGIEEFGRLSIPLVVALGVGTALFFLFIVAKGLGAQRAKPVTGVEGLLGATGVARGDLTPEGLVFVQGERWQATAEEGEVKDGTPVQVVGIEGFRLKVRRMPSGL